LKKKVSRFKLQIKNHTVAGEFLLQCHIWQGFGGKAKIDQARQQKYALREQRTTDFSRPSQYASSGLL
jgi:hypothetical protein